MNRGRAVHVCVMQHELLVFPEKENVMQGKESGTTKTMMRAVGTYEVKRNVEQKVCSAGLRLMKPLSVVCTEQT